MRSTRDRIRHTVSFELIGLALITPLGALAFGLPMHDTGILALVSALLAMLWNYLFNLGFDHVLARRRGHARKTLALRVIHAVLFELTLMAVLMPFIAWYLGTGLLQALLIDLSFTAFFMVYAFGFNWAYDLLFPLPDTTPG